jgi:hypothetical protein
MDDQRAEIERRALEIAADLDRKSGPFSFEIVPDTTPTWHLVKTAPGQADKASRFLEARGAGVFLPKFVHGARLVMRHEVVDLSDRLLFSSLLFVFVWDILKHWRRVMACPGVQSIMVDGNENPVVVPWDQIYKLMARQYTQGISRPKRRKRRFTFADDHIRISNASHWHVDGRERNRLLTQPLGAAS